MLRPRWKNARHRWRHSLKWRLVTLFLLLAVATAAVFLYGMQRALQSGWQGVAKPLVADYVDKLAAEIGTPPSEARARAIAERLPLSVRIDGPLLRFDSHPGQREPRRFKPDDDEDVRSFGSDGWGFARTTADGHRIRFGLAGSPPGDRPRWAAWATLAALLLLTALAYAVVRHLLRPLDAINAGVARFGAGQFEPPIPVRRRDELGELAARINTMAHSLHGRLDAQRALLLAISHELRSPLTRARINAELIDDSAPRTALLRDLAEMRDLISELLESERLSGAAEGRSALNKQAVDLPSLVRELVDTQFAGAGLQLQLAGGIALVNADPVRLRLLLRNLIDNALRHGGDAAQRPVVALQPEDGGQRLHLSVRDFGPGVAAEHLALLAEPFYRTDSARQRATGGVGLGLYLCRLVAEAHGGELTVRNAAPGLEVSAALPI